MVSDPGDPDEETGDPDASFLDGPARRHSDGSDDPVPASTLVIEVDGFDEIARPKKRVKVLDQVSWVVSDTLRSTDAVYRHGESGFCAVLANTPESEALGAAGRVRINVEIMPLLAEAGITVTVGVAAGGDHDLAETIARAERALSDTTGPNRVVRAAVHEPG